jgi:DNA-binding NarL/FixJ family response regulator
MSIRILLADDHAIVRAGIRALLSHIPDMTVIAEAGNGREAIAAAQAHQPDVALMDIEMPELNGIDATTRIVRELPNTKVIILSMHDTEPFVRQALMAGAVGYVLKDSMPPELELAIRAVTRGERFLSPRVSKHVIDGYMAEGGAGPKDPVQKLTSRQREVLQLLAEGHSTKDIATRLTLSVKTVETHRADIMRRIDIHDVPGLVRFAMRSGLVGEHH